MSKLSDKLYRELVESLDSSERTPYIGKFKDTNDYVIIFDSNWFTPRVCIIRKSDLKAFYYTKSGKLTRPPQRFDSIIRLDFFENENTYKLYKHLKNDQILISSFRQVSVVSFHRLIKLSPRIYKKIAGSQFWNYSNLLCRFSQYINAYGLDKINGLDDKSIETIVKYGNGYTILLRDSLKDEIKILPYDTYLYRDYISLKERLGLNGSKRYTRYPKIEKLQKLHDELVVLVRREEEVKEKEWLDSLNSDYINNSYDICKKLEYTFGDYCIIAPKHIVELNTEGKVLHHCVATYKESVSNGNEYILFLRRSNALDIPFLTINIDKDGYCRQIHGNYNCNISSLPDSKNIQEFLLAWCDKNKFINKKSIINNCNQIKCHL